jgi:hypothetical protein
LAFTPFSIPVAAYLGTRLGFRWRDGLLLLVPFVNVYQGCRICMREAARGNGRRYWADRNDEETNR